MEQKPEKRSSTIQVVVVHSHSGGKRVWDYLKAHWNEFGTTKINITHQRDFTLDSLVKACPDIVVCSDPAGAPYQYTDQEVSDLYEFITQGINRHIIGTYATFYHQEGPADKPHIYDTRRLASLFGLDPNLGYTTKKLHCQPKFDVQPEFRDSILWRGVALPYISLGYNSTQLPTSGTPQLTPMPWLAPGGEVKGAVPNTYLMAKSSDDLCIIINFVEYNFSSLFISHMPEYESIKRTKEDLQLLYNAFVLLFNQGLSSMSLVSMCSEVIAQNIGLRSLQSKISITDLPTDVQEKLYTEVKMLGKLDARVRAIFGKKDAAEE